MIIMIIMVRKLDKMWIHIYEEKRRKAVVWLILDLSPTNSIHKYVDQNGSATMLAARRLADFAPEVNLRNLLCAGDEAHKQGIHPGFETQGICHQKFKTGVSLPPPPRKEKKCITRNIRFDSEMVSGQIKESKKKIVKRIINLGKFFCGQYGKHRKFQIAMHILLSLKLLLCLTRSGPNIEFFKMFASYASFCIQQTFGYEAVNM